MVPEDELVAVGRVILAAPLDKAGQRVGIGHGAAARVLHQALQAAVFDLIDLVILVADDIVVPLGAAAGIGQDADVIAQLGVGHLHQVAGRHGAAGLQVRAAHIDHDGDIVLIVAVDRRALGPGAGGHRGVHTAAVGLDRGGTARGAIPCAVGHQIGIGALVGGEKAVEQILIGACGRGRATGGTARRTRRCWCGIALGIGALLYRGAAVGISEEHASAATAQKQKEHHRQQRTLAAGTGAMPGI